MELSYGLSAAAWLRMFRRLKRDLTQDTKNNFCAAVTKEMGYMVRNAKVALDAEQYDVAHAITNELVMAQKMMGEICGQPITEELEKKIEAAKEEEKQRAPSIYIYTKSEDLEKIWSEAVASG